MQTLTEQEWTERAAAHRARLAFHVDAHLQRSHHQQKHPVADFLFRYYAFSPNKLMSWQPGFGLALQGEQARTFLADRHYHETPGGIALDPKTYPPQRHDSLRWVLGLCEKVAARPPRFACYGLHEWAMVYRTDAIRHGQLPLRMSPDDLARFVDSQKIVCSHFDAFRFFTPAARPLNTLQPERPTIHDLEQGGCLHANMDLYKWAFKFWPWVSSDLLADSFLLAIDARTLDMQGSAYDCRSLGLDPIAIETPEGRELYADRQRELAGRAAALRARMIVALRTLLEAVAPDNAPLAERPLHCGAMSPDPSSISSNPAATPRETP